MAAMIRSYGDLYRRFGQILGRAPTTEEMTQLMTDKDSIALSYSDNFLVALMLMKRERILLQEVFERQLALLDKRLQRADEGRAEESHAPRSPEFETAEFATR